MGLIVAGGRVSNISIGGLTLGGKYVQLGKKKSPLKIKSRNR